MCETFHLPPIILSACHESSPSKPSCSGNAAVIFLIPLLRMMDKGIGAPGFKGNGRAHTDLGLAHAPLKSL